MVRHAMKLIDRYIFRVVLSHAGLGLLIFTFILFVPQLVRLMELVVRNSGSASGSGCCSFARCRVC